MVWQIGVDNFQKWCFHIVEGERARTMVEKKRENVTRTHNILSFRMSHPNEFHFSGWKKKTKRCEILTKSKNFVHTTKFNVYDFARRRHYPHSIVVYFWFVSFYLKTALRPPHFLFVQCTGRFYAYNVQTCSNKWQNKRFTVCFCAILTA